MHKQKIITLGPKFSYSYNVALKYYPNFEIVPVDTIGAVFLQLDKTSQGIVPIENMLNGSVRETFLALQKNGVHIFRGFDYTIEHVLSAQENNFKIVMSHAQALVQCRQFVNSLREKGVEVFEASSTSRAMELAKRDKNIAAIGSLKATEFYGLKVIKNNISDKSSNLTRFIQIGLGNYKIAGSKTSIIITPQEDRSGLLFEILSVFKIKDLNLSKIESIPTGKKMNDYIFYMDIEENLESKNMQDALKFLQTFVEVNILGSYNVEN